MAIPLVAGVTEMVYIAIMASLGQASHFNLSSGFTSIMYSLMGVGAAAMVLVLPWLGYLIARQNPMTNPLILAIVAGLCVTCVLGGGFGSYLGGQDGHWVNASRTDASGVWLFNWATDGGDLRVAHFFGMHAMHAFPIFALLLPKNWGAANQAAFTQWFYGCVYGIQRCHLYSSAQWPGIFAGLSCPCDSWRWNAAGKHCDQFSLTINQCRRPFWLYFRG